MPMFRSVDHIEWPLALALQHEDSSDRTWLLMQKDGHCPSCHCHCHCLQANHTLRQMFWVSTILRNWRNRLSPTTIFIRRHSVQHRLHRRFCFSFYVLFQHLEYHERGFHLWCQWEGNSLERHSAVGVVGVCMSPETAHNNEYCKSAGRS